MSLLPPMTLIQAGSSLWPASPAVAAAPSTPDFAEPKCVGPVLRPAPSPRPAPLRAQCCTHRVWGARSPAPSFALPRSCATRRARMCRPVRACSLPRSVGLPRRAPRRPRRRLWHTAHLLPLSPPPPPPGLDGGPRPTSGTHKKETRRRRRRHP